MKKFVFGLIWILVALLGAGAYAVLALNRHEQINSIYILVAALATYAIGFRFYSKWIAARVLTLNDRRATPCEVHEDGKDYVKTNKWIVFGHHFAAISGPGPLVGPVLAAQFGYLPGTLWILIGVVLGGAVQDFVILFCSMRRDGKSLGQMVKEELNSAAGVIGIIAILSIMIILLAVLALVVVNALADSPWGVFTIAATIPIAMFMGGYLRFWRVGKVLEASAIGVILLLLAVWGGQFIHGHATLSKTFTMERASLAFSIIGYGLAASVLPVWLLLAPRDYLSTFMKLGTIFALALGVFLVLPQLQMPALTKFIDGSGPIVPGKLFPFCFITIACGSISGFHTLISSGITPKIITRESYARSIGYGAMCLESLVAIMALIAACTLEPGVYLTMNLQRGPGVSDAAIVEKASSYGFAVTPTQMQDLADKVHEKTLVARAGGAATLAVGMANIFAKAIGDRWLGIWYHFALMFEALFILTTLDAGTRVGRYLLQDALGHLWKPLGDTRNIFANVAASALVVAAWGYFLVKAVYDPDGGIKALWPIFGIANQLLASIALCLATTVILKMQLAPAAGTTRTPKPIYALVTLIPLLWLLSVTGTASIQKILDSDPKIGFLARADQLKNGDLPKAQEALIAARATGDVEKTNAAEKKLKSVRSQISNQYLDAGVTGAFLTMVVLVTLISLREWILLLARKKLSELKETSPVWLPEYAIVESKPLHIFAWIGLAFALARELSGEAAMDRVQETVCQCESHEPDKGIHDTKTATGETREKIYMQTLDDKFKGVRRCC